jgi:hypothetical protein
MYEMSAMYEVMYGEDLEQYPQEILKFTQAVLPEYYSLRVVLE